MKSYVLNDVLLVDTTMFFTARQKSKQYILLAGALLLFSIFMSLKASAEHVKFPDEELATESVLPLFDQPQAVRNRLVPLAGKFEIGGGASYDLIEPFFKSYGININATYNLTEENGINFFYNYYMAGSTSYVDQLNNIPNTSSKFNLQNAPAPSYQVLINYQYTAFYGKLSLTKDFVMNLSLFGFVGGGGFKIGDELNPTLDVGLGQKFYFTPSSALRFDLRFNFYQGPDVVGSTIPATGGTVSASNFTKRLFIGSLLSVSYVYLF